MEKLEKITTNVLVKTTLGKDGKTYENLIVQFIDLKDNVVYSLQVEPSFKMTSKQYGLYNACVKAIKKEQ